MVKPRTSCHRCQCKKVKCDKGQPCSGCTRAGIPQHCTYGPLPRGQVQPQPRLQPQPQPQQQQQQQQQHHHQHHQQLAAPAARLHPGAVSWPSDPTAGTGLPIRQGALPTGPARRSHTPHRASVARNLAEAAPGATGVRQSRPGQWSPYPPTHGGSGGPNKRRRLDPGPLAHDFAPFAGAPAPGLPGASHQEVPRNIPVGSNGIGTLYPEFPPPQDLQQQVLQTDLLRANPWMGEEAEHGLFGDEGLAVGGVNDFFALDQAAPQVQPQPEPMPLQLGYFPPLPPADFPPLPLTDPLPLADPPQQADFLPELLAGLPPLPADFALAPLADLPPELLADLPSLPAPQPAPAVALAAAPAPGTLPPPVAPWEWAFIQDSPVVMGLMEPEVLQNYIEQILALGPASARMALELVQFLLGNGGKVNLWLLYLAVSIQRETSAGVV